MAELKNTDIAAMLVHIASNMIAAKDELTELDAALGDGDLGRTVSRGFAAIEESLAGDAAGESDIGKLLYGQGKIFANAAPSSFGALFGTALMKGGMALKGKNTIGLPDIAEATQVALDALVERGKAQVGDKTMLDAIAPALEAMVSIIDDEDQAQTTSTGDFLEAAAKAAQQGAESTASMQSRIGRASWQGERSAGKMDPGARAIAMMLEFAAQHFQK